MGSTDFVLLPAINEREAVSVAVSVLDGPREAVLVPRATPNDAVSVRVVVLDLEILTLGEVLLLPDSLNVNDTEGDNVG